jgi:hypothetical protein
MLVCDAKGEKYLQVDFVFNLAIIFPFVACMQTISNDSWIRLASPHN